MLTTVSSSSIALDRRRRPKKMQSRKQQMARRHKIAVRAIIHGGRMAASPSVVTALATAPVKGIVGGSVGGVGGVGGDGGNDGGWPQHESIVPSLVGQQLPVRERAAHAEFASHVVDSLTHVFVIVKPWLSIPVRVADWTEYPSWELKSASVRLDRCAYALCAPPTLS